MRYNISGKNTNTKELQRKMFDYLKRFIRLIFGLTLYALGTDLTIYANIGLGPWEAFHTGVSQNTGLSYGTVVFWTGMVILVLDVLLKEKIGVGTVCNVFLIGSICDLIFALNIIPYMSSFWSGTAMMLLGLFVVCLGSFFYIGSAFGAGPRDSLMIALKKRFPNIPVGAIRIAIEGTALLLGWLMGAKIGLGTVLSAFGIGVILQLTFKIFRFDVKSVRPENLFETINNVKALLRKA